MCAAWVGTTAAVRVVSRGCGIGLCTIHSSLKLYCVRSSWFLQPLFAVVVTRGDRSVGLFFVVSWPQLPFLFVFFFFFFMDHFCSMCGILSSKVGSSSCHDVRNRVSICSDNFCPFFFSSPFLTCRGNHCWFLSKLYRFSHLFRANIPNSPASFEKGLRRHYP